MHYKPNGVLPHFQPPISKWGFGNGVCRGLGACFPIFNICSPNSQLALKEGAKSLMNLMIALSNDVETRAEKKGLAINVLAQKGIYTCFACTFYILMKVQC